MFGTLTSGGFDDPASESVRAAERITAELGRQSADLVALYSSDGGTIDDAGFRTSVSETLNRLREHPDVASVISYYDTKSPSLVSTDRHSTFAAITLAAPDEDGKRAAYDGLRPALDAPGVRTEVGGVVAFQHTTDELTERDLARGEMFAMPVVLVLLVLLFGGVVAAGMPLLIGVLAVLGALTTTRVIAGVTDVSTFAVNTITLLGLGMSIDYSLLVVSRFREELRAGCGTPQAIARTMASAGRTVLVSGLTIVLALASLLIFPQVFLRSMGLGGMSAVLVAMIGSLTVLPSMLAILGERINAIRVPLPWRRGHKAQPATTGQHGAWARLAQSVMRRPVLYLVAVLGVLGVLAQPFLQAEFGGVDERVMPTGTEARVVTERIAEEFPGRRSAPIDTYVEGASPAQVEDLIIRLRGLPGVTGAEVAASKGASTLVSVSYDGTRTGDHAYDAVRAIRDLPTPAGVEVLVGGRSALDVDRLDSLGDRLPWMAGLMATATILLLFLAFGSVLLPIKAVAMNLISIATSFGAVVWIFQDGHLSGWLGFTPTGFIEPTIPILLLVILFGLSTDYEVFLLSRVREAWDETGDSIAAVATGVQRTGGIITAAALLLVVVVGGFATGQITFAKMIGIGMVTSIVVDATLVRMLLVPATMRLLGRWSWWAPGPLAAVYRQHGIRESGEPVTPPGQPSLVPQSPLDHAVSLTDR
ncbi:MMPL family transporter [Kribbella caucasensis]|uniref:MMPL family transporter n=1 Tax=Kribbella caucasensis TaxID=2512215 RepID=UPI001EDFEB3D|nr:MMPL family transporter [Kribbella sp. VKM Ac-2527]